MKGFDSNASAGLEISPALVELNGEKGKTYTLKLRVHNVTNSDLAYDSSTNDFSAKDETGSPKVLLDTKLPDTASVKSWVKPIGRFTLRTQETRQLDVTITIPKSAEPGGHYGIVSFAGKDPQIVSTGVGVNVSTGLLMLIRVDGAIKENLSLATLTAEQNGKRQDFFETGPIMFVTRLQNEGNVHVKPAGTIEIRNMFGGVVATLPVNDKLSNVLPGSIRRFEANLNKDWMIGRYEANLTVGYGTTGQAIMGSTSFWVIPYRLLLAVLAILLTLGFIVRRLTKVYNRRIIEKFKQADGNKTKKTKS